MTNLNSALLEILRCPESRQRLSVASAELLAELESKRLAGTLFDENEATVSERIEAGLLREDGARFFIIRAGIPVMTLGDSISLR